MNKNLLQSAILLIAMAGLLVMVGCDTAVDDIKLKTPANVSITVEARTMTVTWDAVSNAQGYEIYTTSENCNSGNKIINTKVITATGHDGTGAYVKGDKTNGAVEILAHTKIQITLMPQMMGDQNVPMATKVTAKVKALGGEAGGNNYISSGYSAEEEKSLGSGMGM